MAQCKAYVYNRGMYMIMLGGLGQNAGQVHPVRVILLKTAGLFDRTDDWVSDISSDEVSGDYTVGGERPTVTYGRGGFNSAYWYYDWDQLMLLDNSLSPSIQPDYGLGFSLGYLLLDDDVHALAIYLDGLTGADTGNHLLFYLDYLNWEDLDGSRKYSVVFPGGFGQKGIFFTAEKAMDWPIQY